MATSRLCSIQGCCKPEKARGWCTAHYSRWKKHGDTGVTLVTFQGDPMKFIQDVALHYEGDDCLDWPFGKTGGRGMIWRDGKHRVVAREICTMVHGEPPHPSYQAAHSCGRGHEGCCTKKHLRWATSAENKADQILHGTSNHGERSNSAKITREDVLAIRALKGTVSGRELALRYGVSFSHICSIQTNKCWKWLSPPD